MIFEKEMRTMEEQIFNSMIQQGAFAALFVWMLFTTQKKNEQREEQYQKVIEKNQQVIEEQAKAFSSLSKDLSDVKRKILGNGDEK
ncbi:hypothetical protein bthur0013_36680 [Bacillus thuringiensis IBL 200]|nr:hypothetical protein bthur0013_36680 [Bacillus thuringiensis IBL 200]